MTRALMIPAMPVTTTQRNVAAAVVVVVVVVAVAAAGAGDTMIAHGIMTVGTAIMTGAHAISTGGDMDVNHGITIAAMMTGGIKL
jgi:hypothetical protein